MDEEEKDRLAREKFKRFQDREDKAKRFRDSWDGTMHKCTKKSKDKEIHLDILYVHILYHVHPYIPPS